jgi:hypothetical protein
MRKNTTRIGILATAGAGVTALAIAGFALPANADETTATWDDSTTTTTVSSPVDAFTARLHELRGGDGNTFGNIGLDGGLISAPLIQGPLVGGVASGPILSGNDTPVASGNDAPIASGNETLNGNDVSAPVGSGNEVTAPVASGNDVSAPVEAPVGSGNDVSAPVDAGVEAPVGSGNDTGVDVGNIGADVRDLVDDVTGLVGLDLGR